MLKTVHTFRKCDFCIQHLRWRGADERKEREGAGKAVEGNGEGAGEGRLSGEGAKQPEHGGHADQTNFYRFHLHMPVT